MEVMEFIKQKERMCDYYGDVSCVRDDSRETCPALNIDCSLGIPTSEQLVEIVEQWAKEHPEESSDLHAIIDALEDRIDKLDVKVSNESLILRELSKRNYDTHKELADRIAALEKDPVESMNEPKRTNKNVLLAAFPNARMNDNGIPNVCPLALDTQYDCNKFPNCLLCKRTHWLAESEEE